MRRLQFSASVVAIEVEASGVVRVGRTPDRPVIGQMVDLAKAIPYHLPEHGWNATTTRIAEDRPGAPAAGQPTA